MGIDRRLHADGADQLQRVVLHHVAKRAGLVVEGAALFHAQVFGNRDLDVGDVLAAPDRLEQRIAKAHRKQVLHRRLAQVMVDAEHLVLVQHGAHRFVDRAVGCQVMAQRLFQHHAGRGAVQAGGGNVLNHLGKQVGRSSHVHHQGVGVARLQSVRQVPEILGLGQIDAVVVQQLREFLEFLGAGALGFLHGLEAAANLFAVLLVGQVIARYADDATVGWQRAMAKSLKQCRHQFAPYQVACAAEKNQIKTHGKTRSCSCGNEVSS